MKKRLRGLTLRQPDAVFSTVHRWGQGRHSTRVDASCLARKMGARSRTQLRFFLLRELVLTVIFENQSLLAQLQVFQQ